MTSLHLLSGEKKNGSLKISAAKMPNEKKYTMLAKK